MMSKITYYFIPWAIAGITIYALNTTPPVKETPKDDSRIVPKQTPTITYKSPIRLGTLESDPPVLQPSQTIVEYKVPFRWVGKSIHVSVRINNTVTSDFLLDSGATEVFIPPDVVFMLKLPQQDMLGENWFMMADGRRTKAQMIHLTSVQLANITIYDVQGGILGPEGLLGQSFLTRFKSWSIDNDDDTIVFKYLNHEWKEGK